MSLQISFMRLQASMDYDASVVLEPLPDGPAPLGPCCCAFPFVLASVASSASFFARASFSLFLNRRLTRASSSSMRSRSSSRSE